MPPVPPCPPSPLLLLVLALDVGVCELMGSAQPAVIMARGQASAARETDVRVGVKRSLFICVSYVKNRKRA